VETRQTARAWGLVAIAFFATHAANLLAHGLGEHALWSCNLASLLVAAGFLFGRPALNGVGFLWLAVALPAWVWSLFASDAVFLWSTALVHVGNLAVATWGVRTMGIPRGTWWRALLGLVALWAVTRFGFRFETNVNLARTFWFGWEARLVPYPVYMAILFTLEAAVFLALEKWCQTLFFDRGR
jgi:hypothetical protein